MLPARVRPWEAAGGGFIQSEWGEDFAGSGCSLLIGPEASGALCVSPQLWVWGTSPHPLQQVGADLGSDLEVGPSFLTPAGRWLLCSLQPVKMISGLLGVSVGSMSPSPQRTPLPPAPYAHLPGAGDTVPALRMWAGGEL